MRQYLLYQRYVCSFGGSRLDQICDVKEKIGKEKMVTLDSFSARGEPEEQLLKELARQVSERYPISEEDTVYTIPEKLADPLPGFIGMGIAIVPVENDELAKFHRYLLVNKHE